MPDTDLGYGKMIWTKKDLMVTMLSLVVMSVCTSCESLLNVMDSVSKGLDTTAKSYESHPEKEPTLLSALGSTLVNTADNLSTKEDAAKERTARERLATQGSQNGYGGGTTGYSTGTQSGSSQKSARPQRCTYCSGSGRCTARNASARQKYCSGTGRCNYCNGDGYNYRSGNRITCTTCSGKGKCTTCRGTGQCQRCHGKGTI